jgi:hypothetical protein
MKNTKNIIVTLSSLLLLVGSLQCQASEEWVESHIDWAKSIIPDQLNVSVQKTKTHFKGYKQQHIEVLAIQKIKGKVTLETELSMDRARSSGIEGQRELDFSATVMPRYQASRLVSLGLGVKYEVAPILQLPGTERQSLGAARAFVMSSRIKGFNDKQWLQIDVANYKRDSFNVAGNFASSVDGFSENTISLRYQGQF